MEEIYDTPEKILTVTSDTILSPQTLARTYSVQGYSDTWECVLDYRAVIEYHNTHPDQSPHEISKQFSPSRKRIRGWIEGAQPDPVRAVTTAEEKGWLDATWSSDIGRAFNSLVAFVFSSGSIGSRDFAPVFVVDGTEKAAFVSKALEILECGTIEQHTDDPDRATQLVPQSDKALLGRALHTLDAPIGDKNAEKDITLPSYLTTAPDAIREEFVNVYLSHRGWTYPDKESLKIGESRPEPFYESLQALIESTIEEGDVTRLSDGMGLYIPAETASKFDVQLSWGC